jgi:hypothetical protein
MPGLPLFDRISSSPPVPLSPCPSVPCPPSSPFDPREPALPAPAARGRLRAGYLHTHQHTNFYPLPTSHPPATYHTHSNPSNSTPPHLPTYPPTHHRTPHSALRTPRPSRPSPPLHTPQPQTAHDSPLLPHVAIPQPSLPPISIHPTRRDPHTSSRQTPNTRVLPVRLRIHTHTPSFVLSCPVISFLSLIQGTTHTPLTRPNLLPIALSISCGPAAAATPATAAISAPALPPLPSLDNSPYPAALGTRDH